MLYFFFFFLSFHFLASSVWPLEMMEEVILPIALELSLVDCGCSEKITVAATAIVVASAA